MNKAKYGGQMRLAYMNGSPAIGTYYLRGKGGYGSADAVMCFERQGFVTFVG